MIVHNGGHFSPMRTLTSFYTVVGIMILVNVVFNERRNLCSINYWLGEFLVVTYFGFLFFFLDVLINSFSGTLRFDNRNHESESQIV